MRDKKEHPIDAMTRADFEQLFEDHTQRLVETINGVDGKVDKLDRKVDTLREDMEDRFDRLERSTHDDITVIFQELYKIKKHVGLPVETDS